MTRPIKVAFGLLILCFAGLVFIFSVAGYWRFHNYNPLVISGMAQTEQPSYAVGSRVLYSIKYCKNVTLPATVERTLVGKVTVPIDSVKRNIPAGCGTSINSTFILPVNIDPGIYHIEYASTYQTNPLYPSTVRYRSNDFTVTR